MTSLAAPLSLEVPQALHEIDAATGAFTQRAYEQAVVAAPHLAEITIRQENGRGSRFNGHPEGLAASTITLNADPEYYRDPNRRGRVITRMHEFSALYRSLGFTPGIPHLITAVALHELGHGDEFQRLINEAGGDTHAAFTLGREVRKSQLATLPLGMSTSRAEAAWDNNTDGYRDKARALGWTDELWAIQKTRNTAAYTNLTCENVADRFALGVLATLYSRQN